MNQMLLLGNPQSVETGTLNCFIPKTQVFFNTVFCYAPFFYVGWSMEQSFQTSTLVFSKSSKFLLQNAYLISVENEKSFQSLSWRKNHLGNDNFWGRSKCINFVYTYLVESISKLIYSLLNKRNFCFYNVCVSKT